MEKKKVLIIDDNPVIVRMAEAFLNSAGFDVVYAHSGPQGLELARAENPDIILLDIILPDMHGFEVFKKLRSDQATKGIPIIYITGTGLEEVASSEPDIKADGYITKPFGSKELFEAIKKVSQK